MSDAARQTREEALRRAVLAGDEVAWRTWYDQAFDPVRRFVTWRMRDCRDGCDEVLQETWLVAVRRIRDFDPQRGSFLDWVRGIASHVLKNQQRKRRATATLSLSEEIVQQPHLVAGDNLARSARIVEVLQFLPDRYADVLREKYLEQRSVADIAASWNETSKAIESLLTRARQAFREAFGMDEKSECEP